MQIYHLGDNISLIFVRYDKSFEFEQYLIYFQEDLRDKIISYRYRKDQFFSFVSTYFKCYYLPDLLGKDIKIDQNIYGKPIITNYPNYDFNISHSGEFIVLAVAKGFKVGIDIEYIDYNFDIRVLSGLLLDHDTSFSNEKDNIISYLKSWTRYEAFFKAIGKGVIDNKLRIYQYPSYAKFKSYINDNHIISLCLLPII